ncbi:hypothetical protein BDR07DRAFT_1425708, partial [Suillus spraguei]
MELLIFRLDPALVHHTQLTPATLRCMHCPAKPQEMQPSALHAHSSVRKVVISLWMTVAGCVVWAGFYYNRGTDALTSKTWSFLPNDTSDLIG